MTPITVTVTLIAGMAEFIPSNQKVDITCPVCLDTFKRPRSLPCLHTFCTECLQGHIVNTSQASLLSAFYCPVCRAQTKPPRAYTQRDTWAEQFPVNHWILCYMEESEKETVRDDIVMCECHPEFTVRLYCADHGRLCCPMCIATDHRKCEDVKELKEVAKQFDVAKEASELNSEMTTSLTFVNEFRRTRHKRMESLVTSRENIIHDIRGKKDEITEHLNTIEAAVLENIDEVSDDLLRGIETDIQWCNITEESIDEYKHALHMSGGDNSDIQNVIRLLKVQHKVKELRNKIQENSNSLSQPVERLIEFEFDENLIEFRDTFKAFGNLRVIDAGATEKVPVASTSRVETFNETEQSIQNDQETAINNESESNNHLQTYLSRDEVSRTTWYADLFETVEPVITESTGNVNVELIKRLQVAEPVSKNKCWVTSIMPMPNECLIIADKCDKSLKLIKDEKLLSRTKLGTSPWNIAKVSETSVAVSYPQENLVRFFDVYVNDIVVKIMTTVSILGSPLKCDSTWTIQVPCFGITCLRKSLIVSCEDCLQMFSLKGKLLDTLSRKVDGQALFRRATFLASDSFRDVVFVSDEGANSVLAIQSAHKRLVSYPKYVYTHPKLRCPQGISVGVDGSILVCAFGSKTIHMISSSGTLTNIFEINVRPWSVACLTDTNRLIISVYPETEECRHIFSFEMIRR